MRNTGKQAWSAPRLTIHGSVEQITQGTIECKRQGNGDDLARTISTVPRLPSGECPRS